jgi:hypothetical protein
LTNIYSFQPLSFTFTSQSPHSFDTFLPYYYQQGVRISAPKRNNTSKEIAMDNTTFNNVSKSGRAARIAVGLALVYSTALLPGTLGLAAVLPLLAIYPLSTAVLGWDPIVQLVARNSQNRANRRTKIGQLAHQA